MKRADLTKLAEKNGYKKGKETPKNVLDKIRSELEKYFNSPEGREALHRAPKCMLYTVNSRDEVMKHETTKDLAISLLLKEFEGRGGSG